jgi:two-component system KDP operon response regulator KdpE
MTEGGHLVLVVEDEKSMRRFIAASLGTQGYRVAEAENGRSALTQMASRPPDVVILDLGLPDMDGMEVLNEFRAWSQAPVIVLSAREKERDKVQALDQGADDYLSKPFGVQELFARIRAAMRRANRLEKNEEGGLFSVRELLVNLARRTVHRAGEEIHLTPNEYNILAVLVRHAGKVVTHERLLREVWGPNSAEQVHYVRIYLSSLRRKLEEDPTRPKYLLTELGVGYRLLDE